MPVKLAMSPITETTSQTPSNHSKFKSDLLGYGWRLGLTGALLYVVFRQVNLVELWVRVRETSIWAMLLYLVMEVALAWLAAWRWSILALSKPTKSEINSFFQATMLGMFYNLFMPSNIGGDLIKWTSLSHIPISKSKLVFTMVLDRLMGIMGLIVWGFIGVAMVKLWQIAVVPDVVVWFFFALFAGVALFIGFVYSPLEFRHLPVFNRISPLLRAEEYLSNNKQAFMQAFMLGTGIQGAWLVLLYILAVAVGFKTGWWQFFAIQPVVSAVTSLPVSLAGFGATEAGFLYFYKQLGVPVDTIVAFTALLGIFRILIGLIGWGVGMTSNHKK